MKAKCPLQLAVLLLSAAVSAAPAATLTVTNAADSGPGTLRQALTDANADASPDLVTIGFGIPGAGVRTIAPLTGLPAITRPVTIDGYTQPGASPNTLAAADNAVLLVELSGASLSEPAYGLRFTASGCTVRGLVINRFPDTGAILVEASDKNVVEGNFIGTDATGTNALANRNGILNLGAGLRVGGSTPAFRNIIAGNNYVGINMGGCVSNQVLGNFVGVGADGVSALPNGGWGMYLQTCFQTQIGGPSPGARNIISGNPNGCWINAGGSNLIQGNFIGTDASGTLPRGNVAGVVLEESSNNLIGGTAVGAGNLISGNLAQGVSIEGITSVTNVVVGNFIGTDVTGTNALGNETGIYVSGPAGTRIGGLTPASRNIISGNSYGISQNGTEGTMILGNYIGLGVDGTALVSNTFGIFLHYSSRTQIGGSTPGVRNVISGNLIGCYLNVGGSNIIRGNFIGTDASGSLSRGNVKGVELNESRHNLIGGSNAGAGNLLSGNSSAAVAIEGLSNVVTGNLIGTDVTGTTALGNGYYGVFIGGTSGNVIGGTTPGAGNVISGNGLQGIAIYYGGTGNVIQGNAIGTDITGTMAVSNWVSGILIVGSPGNTIGGTTPGAGNVIAFSPLAGVAITEDGATNNAILGNSIFAIAGPGIDLGYDGLTPNDPGDADGSPNHLQNFPEITSAALVGGNLTVRYRIDSVVANSAYPLTVEFFRADSGGEGKTLIHRHIYDTAQTFTNIIFTPATTVQDGDPVVATVTDANGNTSEFSAAAIAALNHPPVVAIPIADQGRTYGTALNYSFPVTTFSDPDAGDTLSYMAGGLPPGITFDGPTRTFSGTLTTTGLFAIIVTATDNGIPPLSTDDEFNLTVLRAPITVTNLADSGPGTLRQAIADAVPGDTIDFAVSGTILLVNHLQLSKSLTIAGPGARNLVIRGSGSRLLNVSAGPTAISGLTLSFGSDLYETPSGGGAIFNSAYLTLSHCEISHNESIFRGGAVVNIGGSATLTVIGCTFADNSMSGGFGDGGGAIWSANLLRITNCTFWDNYSAFNGGAVDTSGDAVIVSTTIVGNRADSGSGGGIFNGGGTLALQNSILSGNVIFYGIYWEEVGGGITSGDYNLLQYTNGLVMPGTHNVRGQDPILSPLRDNGGPTRTFGLASTSPALNVADGGTSPAADQRGVPRPQDGGYDIGAFEGALPPNTRPSIANPIPDQFTTYQAVFSYTVPANTFSDPDAGQTFTYSVSDLPPYLIFNPTTRTFSGIFHAAGTNPVTVTVRDDGAPPLSTNVTFNIIAPKLPITARADDASRIIGYADPTFTITYYGLARGDGPNVINNPPLATTTTTPSSPSGTYPIEISGGSDDVYDIIGLTNGTLTVTLFPLRAEAANASRGVGQTNQPFLGFLTGVIYGDNITATYTSAATPASPAGEYLITPVLHDPDGHLTNYDITLVNGTLTVESDAFNPNFEVLHWFGFTNRIGSTSSELIEGLDGWLYGTGGGVNGMGVFRIQKDGTGFIVVRTFAAAEGAPAGPLLEDASGSLYGGGGSVWRMNHDGSGFTVLHQGSASGLLKGSDGLLYGTGGDGAAGMVFRLNMNGSDYTVLHTFAASYLEGLFQSRLIEATNGMLYGTASAGGPGGYYGDGTVFGLNKDGSNFGVLHSFTYGATDGAVPKARLLQGSDGRLYGTAKFGGAGFGGVVFSLNQDGSGYALVKTFDRSSGLEGINPTGPLIESGGKLFGTTTERGPTSYGGTAFKMNLDGSSNTVLKQFADSNADVWDSEFGLFEAADGTLYGAASRGGNLDFNEISGGVFKLNKDGSNYALLYPFSRTGGDGRGSVARASEGSDGMIYGTTQHGGTRDIGTVFRMNKDGSSYAVLHTFTGATTDGSFPAAEVIEASDGMLYGTTQNGGTNLAGTLFRMNKNGSGYAVLRSFDGSDGYAPKGGLIEGSNGKLYGTASQGGLFYNGTVFSLSKDGTGFSSLVSFDGTNGWSPECTLIEDSNGVLYGTTSGSYGGQGTAFRLNKDGSAFAVLHAFDYSAGESIQPLGGLLLASDGALYGTASDRNNYPGYGAVFKLNRNGTGFQTLHRFGIAEMDGRSPYGALAEGADGRIYGVTSYGGVFQNSYSPHSGTIFRLRKNGSGYTVLHHFGSPTSPGGSFLPVDGKGPLFRGSDGSLYALSPNGDPLDFGFVYRLTFPANLPPTVANPIADQNRTVGVPFNFTFAANTFSDPDAGQTLSYTAGGLPPGVVFDDSTRTFSGTPTALGVFTATVTATDNGTPPRSAADMFSITIICPALTLGPASTNLCVGAGMPYSKQFTASGGRSPYTFAFDTTPPFALAPGVTTLSAAGALTGTPILNSAYPAGTNYSFIIVATDVDGCQGRTRYNLRVLPTNTFAAAASQVNLSIPPTGTGGSGIANNDTRRSTNVVSGLTNLTLINRISVTLTIEHPSDGDLVLTLVSPRGERVLLANRRGGGGANYSGTVFDNDAAQSITAGAAPFAEVFRPEVGLGFAGGTNLLGNWVLEIQDAAAGNTGILRDWCLTLSTLPFTPNSGSIYSSFRFGNFVATDSHLVHSLNQTYLSGSGELICARTLDGSMVWTQTLSGAFVGRTLSIDRSSGRGPVVIVPASFASAPGTLLALNPTNGAVVWSNTLFTCADGTLSTPVVQNWTESDAAFRAIHVNEDLVFVASSYSCGGSISNKIYAVRASDGTVAWTFNSSGALALGAGALATDVPRNTVYCSAAQPSGASNTVFAINTTNGMLRWARNLGAEPYRPLVANASVYVATSSNSLARLHKLNPTTGATVWTRALGTRAIQSPILFDPNRRRLVLLSSEAVASSTAYITAVDDSGASPTPAWESAQPIQLSGVNYSLAIAPDFDRVFVSYLFIFNGSGNRQDVRLSDGFVISSMFPSIVPDLLADSDAGGVTLNSLVQIPLTRYRLPLVSLFPSSVMTNDLALSAAVNPPAPLPGQPVTCTLTVTNRGLSAVVPVSVGDMLPRGLQFVSAVVSRGTYSLSTNTFAAELGALLPGGSATISLVLTSNPAGLYEHRAMVGGFTSDSAGANNSVVFSHLFCAPVTLNMQLVNGLVRIAWATNCPDVVLKANTDLNGASWLPVTPAPVVTGSFFVVTNSPSAPQKFYQLRSP